MLVDIMTNKTKYTTNCDDNNNNTNNDNNNDSDNDNKRMVTVLSGVQFGL